LILSNVFMTFAWYAHLRNLTGRPWYEAITLVVFMPFAVLYMRQPFMVDYLYAGVCSLAAIYFIFRNPTG
jgi:uncharacterized protein (DUF486 family)